MPTLSCSTTNWKATSSAKCQPENEHLAESQVAFRFEAHAVSKFYRHRLDGASATGMHSPLHQIHRDRGVWIDRILPYVAIHASGVGFRVEPHHKPGNGTLFRPARENSRSARHGTYVGSKLLDSGNCNRGSYPSSGTINCHSLD